MVSALNSFLGTIRNYLPTNSNNKKTNLQIIHERFGPMAPQETVDYIIQNYFSVYQKNLLKVDEPVLKQMEQVIRRVMVGRNIATAWSGAIIGNNGVSLDATHREIGDEARFVHADQFLPSDTHPSHAHWHNENRKHEHRK